MITKIPNPLKAYVEKTGQKVTGLLEFHSVCVQKKLMEKHIAEAAEMFSQNRRINYDYHRNGSLSECSKKEAR